MLNIFIIPSTIQPLYGVIKHDERFTQTLETIESIKNTVKDEYLILLIDSSTKKLSEEKIETIRKNVNIFLDYSDDKNCQFFNQNWMKSHGENYLLFQSIRYLQQNYNIDNTEGMMYKLGGRCKLLPSFDITRYTSIKNKFIFKKRLYTWRSLEERKLFECEYLLETRLYSWPFNFSDKYLNIIDKNFKLFNYGLDTEHAHFSNISKEDLYEYDKIHVGCIIAASGIYIED